jgi:hypothetical protein
MQPHPQIEVKSLDAISCTIPCTIPTFHCLAVLNVICILKDYSKKNATNDPAVGVLEGF